MKMEALHSRIEKILDRELTLGHHRLSLIGSSSAATLSFILSQANSKNISYLPHVVVCASPAEANKLLQSIQFFDPARTVEILPAFDVSPFDGLEPKQQLVSERLCFLNRAAKAKAGDIFILPIEAAQQKTLPYSLFQKNFRSFVKGDSIKDNFSEILSLLGYQASPFVEDLGQFSIRGGIIDIFSPAHPNPIRLELFGDQIESLRFFSPVNQRSLEDATSFDLIPAKELLFFDNQLENGIDKFRTSVIDRDVPKEEFEEAIRSLSRKSRFPGVDFLLPFFYEKLESPFAYFQSEVSLWILDPMEISRKADSFYESLVEESKTNFHHLINPPVEALFEKYDSLSEPIIRNYFELSSVNTVNADEKTETLLIEYSSGAVTELSSSLSAQVAGTDAWLKTLAQKINRWQEDGYQIFIAIKNQSQIERLKLFFEKINWSTLAVGPEDYQWESLVHSKKENQVVIIPRVLPESVRIKEELLIFLRDEDLLGKKTRLRSEKSTDTFGKEARRLSFGDLRVGDCVVHSMHGIGVYDGLKVMSIGGAASEFIQVSYKDKDKLYLPVYRVGQLQKFSGAAATAILDKLGGPGWEKTKTKVRGHLKDIAADLLKLYAERSQLKRPVFSIKEDDVSAFEMAFPYDETDDQLQAIQDLKKDFVGERPMDRLICGDVGFGKTEVAMRAAFVAAQNKKQIAVLAPTTVLTFQHLETFKKRFQGWPIEIRAINRFVSTADAKKTLKELKEGKVDILIGTHRLLSKDVEYNNLGLLIVDEEQKFGVIHKEKIRKMKSSIDTLTLSATPIPRTLNMSLMGLRDLSIINTAPVDRLPTRTFISKWDDDMIRKSILSEVQRGGQVYFIHNRIQSIYGIADELKKLVPEVRIKIGHGQMDEHELEKTMIQFFHHEIDVLVCTAIVESGMDVPRANTMFIDEAQMMGLSQLYQLRGRVGRSKQRAYCYLLLPRKKKIDKDAQERLKVIQENTALGSGIRIAQYDLELRGTGNLLGEDQSGHINAVGYEMYMDLLNEAVADLRGEPQEERGLEPEINLRVPAMIPDSYIGDIRIRLSYYKALSEIQSPEDLEKIEEELKDQFGPIPDPALNLLGLMLIRSECKHLGVRDVSAGLKNVSLIFTEKTKIKPEVVIQLAMRENKKYAITPDNRLNIRINDITWPRVYEELKYLSTLI